MLETLTDKKEAIMTKSLKVILRDKKHCTDCGRRVSRAQSEKGSSRCVACVITSANEQRLKALEAQPAYPETMTTDEINFYTKRGDANPFARRAL